MFSGRMWNIIEYLDLKKSATFKEIANDLNLSERNVRYDIERVNDMLGIQNLPLIQKGAKGQLTFPNYINLDDLKSEQEFVHTSQERISIMLLTLLLRNSDFKINKFSRDFQVSRSTIKNDLAELESMLRKDGLSINYTTHFFLEGPRKKRVTLLNLEFKKYINFLTNPPSSFHTFEYYCLHVIHTSFPGISIPQVILCVDGLLEQLSCTLTDDSYNWYLSNVMVLVWFIIHKKDYPLEVNINIPYEEEAFETFVLQLESIIHTTITYKNILIMARFLDYTNKYNRLSADVDLIHAESIAHNLIEAMVKELNIPFEQDAILIDGLLNHIIPLIQRIKNHVTIYDDVKPVLGQNEIDIFHIVVKVCSEIDILCAIDSDDEYVYLAIYFLASIKRNRQPQTKRVLLVCGHGYGTTTMLKETLLSEYQIHITDTLPLYKIQTYPDWASVDFILTTTKLNLELPRPTLLVNPILKPDDYYAIETLGIQRKRMMSHYYSLKQKLSFLTPNDLTQVLGVIEKEFGYGSVANKSKSRTFSSLLKYDCISLIDKPLTWQESVMESGSLLRKRGFIDQSYEEDIITTMNSIGFYSISDGSFALLHGKEKTGVHRTSISLIVNKTPVSFGDKQVKVVFCLASENAKQHIPAVITLMRMVKSTNLIKDLESAATKEDLYQTILHCEFQVS